jgi:hypothetical protein
MFEVAVGGVLALGTLAFLIGARIDRESRDAAWGRIAHARRENAETRRDLQERALELDVREEDLDHRERRVDLRETRMLQREEILAEHERQAAAG